MYAILIALHSTVRWLVLASLVYAMIGGYRGWYGAKKFSRFDDTVRHSTATIAHVQFLLGVTLYIISPLVKYFLHNFSKAVHERQLRFFGMEHITVMLLAIVVITIGSAKAKRKAADKEKFKTMAIWFTIGLLLILSSIPWPFSPLVHRPWFRPF